MDWIEAWVNELECIKTWNNPSDHRDTVNISQFILGVDMIVTASKNLLEFYQVDIKTLINIATEEMNKEKPRAGILKVVKEKLSNLNLCIDSRVYKEDLDNQDLGVSYMTPH